MAEGRPRPARHSAGPQVGVPARLPPLVLPSNALELQRLAGNRAVQQAVASRRQLAPVQRWSWDDLGAAAGSLWEGAGQAMSSAGQALTKAGKAMNRAAAAMEKKSASATGKQADSYLDATPLIRRYVQAQVEGRNLTVAGNIQFEDDTTFTRNYVTWMLREETAAGTDDPDTVQAAIARSALARGFVEDGKIHIHKGRAEAGTVIHESLHLYSPKSFKRKVKQQVNEGVTEYFTRIVCTTNGILRSGVYEKQLAAVQKLVDKLPGRDETLADAYFEGDAVRLRPAFDPKDDNLSDAERVAKGRKRLTVWLFHVENGDDALAGLMLT